MSANDFQFHTFGCKVNTYDTGLLQKRLAEKNVYAKPVHILNTCAVTAEATKQALTLVRRIKRENPESMIVVTGCAAQVDTDSFANLPGVDLVVANSHKGELEDLIRNHQQLKSQQKVFKSNIFRKDDLEMGGGLEEKHSRAFLKIQDGCNSFCSFCIIPYARGKSRSLPVQELVNRSRDLHKMGFDEIVLTGVHIGDYEDGTLRLEDLIETLLAETLVPRFRLTSLEPIELSDRLLNLFENSRLCRHFHMSIQSASSKVLKEMKRKYGAEEVAAAFRRIHAKYPDAFVGMDIIAGFPTETEEDFAETYELLEKTPWTRMHVFPYSERSGTRAAILPGLPMADRKARARRLRELSLQRYREQLKAQVGTKKQVLMLKNSDFGLSRDFWNIKVPTTELGKELTVEITGFDLKNESRSEGVLIGIPQAKFQEVRA